MFLKFYLYFIQKISGESCISFFIIFHIIFPFANILRVFFHKPFAEFFFFLLFLLFFFCTLLFKWLPGFYIFIVKNIFNDFIFKNKKLLSLGPLFLKQYPKLFGLYVCVSIYCIYMIKIYPDFFFVYIVHFFCVFFRNIYILPISGYNLIIKINQQKKIYISSNQQETFKRPVLENPECIFCNKQKINEKDLPLFPCLENDQHFKSQFFSWIDWLNSIQPDLKSVKFSAKAGLLTGISWNSYLFFGVSGNKFLDGLNLQKQYIDGVISKVLQQQDSQKKTQILQSISRGIDIEINNFFQNYCEYFEMNGFELMIRYIFQDSKLKNLVNQLDILEMDCIQLEYFNNLFDLESIQSHKKNLHDLLNLLIKYNPNFLEKNKETCPYGDFLEEIYNTLQKNSIEIPIALENNLLFSKSFLY